MRRRGPRGPASRCRRSACSAATCAARSAAGATSGASGRTPACGCRSTSARCSSTGASTGSWPTSWRAGAWWRGRVVAAMNAEFLGPWDVAPRAHPGDGLLDVLDVSPAMSLADRLGRPVPAAAGEPRAPSRHRRQPPGRRPDRVRRADPGVARRRAGGRGAAPVGAGRARRPRLRRLTAAARRTRGRYRRRPCAPGSSTSHPAATARARSTTRRSGPTTCGCARWRRALNHMDLWVTRGLPRPHAAARARAATWPAWSTRSGEQRRRTCAVGDEVVVNPAVAPLEAVVALGVDSPLGRGLRDRGRAPLGRPRRPGGGARAQRRAAARRAGRGRSAPPTRWPRSPPGGCCAGPG